MVIKKPLLRSVATVTCKLIERTANIEVPESALWCQVLCLAIRDLADRWQYKSASIFFSSGSFKPVCWLAGLDPEYVLRVLETAFERGDQVRMKAA